jgi:hypothetical protein
VTGAGLSFSGREASLRSHSKPQNTRFFVHASVASLNRVFWQLPSAQATVFGRKLVKREISAFTVWVCH